MTFFLDWLHDLRLLHVDLAKRDVRELRGQPRTGHVRSQLLLVSPHLRLSNATGLK